MGEGGDDDGTSTVSPRRMERRRRRGGARLKGVLPEALHRDSDKAHDEGANQRAVAELADLAPLVRLSEASIAAEIAAYFPDMQVYKELETTGRTCDDDAGDPSEETARAQRQRGTRHSLVQQLLSDALPSTRDATAEAAPATRSGKLCHQQKPFQVDMKDCSTRVLTALPCAALEGYVVLWAESAITASVTRRCPPSQPQETGARDGTTKVGVASHKAPSPTHPPAAAAPSPSPSSSPSPRVVSLRLHSVHLVLRSTTAASRRRASFALQSVFRVPCGPRSGGSARCRRPSPAPSQEQRLAVSLECYPRHVLHFGLPAYALWNGGGAPCTAEGDSASPPSVLILGLGGNVLGRCLDSILAPEIDIDVVELEPAVLEACLLHGQTPPRSSQLLPAAVPAGVTTRTRAARKGEAVEEGPPRVLCFPRAHQRQQPHRKGESTTGRYTFYLQDAAEFLQPAERAEAANGGGSGGCSSGVGKVYDIIILDCYDPDEETMMVGGGLVERCRSRLRPCGGCLIVNAHVRPSKEVLVKGFLRHGFRCVQGLRVAGCDQSVIVCLAWCDNEDSEGKGKGKTETSVEERCRRFTRENLKAMCEHLNQGPLPSSFPALSCGRLSYWDEAGQRVNPAFAFDAAWMQSCRALPLGGCGGCQSPPRNRQRKRARHETSTEEATTPNVGFPGRCCCAWEHKV